MLALILEPLAFLWRILRAHDSPYQLAGGFTLGALIGVVPKDNLIALGLCVLLCAVRVNKSAGALGALIFVWVGSALDPAADALGNKLLSIDTLQGAYAALYDMPLGPWIGFHNTVVLGSFILGAYFSYPVYWASFLVCRTVADRLAERARRRQVGQLVDNMKLGAPWEVAA